MFVCVAGTLLGQQHKHKHGECAHVYVLGAWKHADAAAFFHAAQVFFRFTHVGVNLIHALLDAVQLLCTAAMGRDGNGVAMWMWSLWTLDGGW